jgi:aspartate beta-hydroxylase
MPKMDLRLTIAELEQAAHRAAERGLVQQAIDAWARIVELEPRHVRALSELGHAAFRGHDFEAARVAYRRAAECAGSSPVSWINVALACQHLDKPDEELECLGQALKLNPYDLTALLLRGKFFERQGQAKLAAASFGAAAAVAHESESLTSELRSELAHARAYVQQHQLALSAFMDERLQAAWAAHRGEDLERFKLSLDILLGRKQRYESQPMRFFVPQLKPIEFFDRSRFQWLDRVEAATDPIRMEMWSVLRDDSAGLAPYIEYGADQPVAQWAELNHSARWSAYHLLRDGKPVTDHINRCPVTAQVLQATPQPDQPGRTPVALFSLLQPKTRIPPHVGASNARLVCHLPLVVPEGCGFRVGNTTRAWIPGEAWVFDDTIEHEAWNHSDQLRAILIWDTWHPDLTEPERRMITEMNTALNAFDAEIGSSSSGYDA